MPCLIALFALFAPRVVIALLFLFTTYLSEAYETVLWPVIGFLFLPLTTLAYAWAWHATDGEVSGVPLVVVVIAVILDLGTYGGGSRTTGRSKNN